jgi:hypothetical protein
VAFPIGIGLALVLGAVDDADETFLNGEKIGAAGQFPPAQGTAWDQPRCYVFAPDLLQEENLLAVRVADWMGGGGIWRGPVAIGPADAMRRLVGAPADHSISRWGSPPWGD